MRVLVADDEAGVLAAYRICLETGDHTGGDEADLLGAELFGDASGTQAKTDDEPIWSQVDYVDQGEDAVAAVARAIDEGRPYSVLFLDMRMPPGIDGKETARRIRELDQGINIVVVTGYSDHSPLEVARVAGPLDKLYYVAKPFKTAEIRSLTGSLCAKWSMEGELRRAHDALTLKNAELEASEARCRHIALHDHLTHLPNRLAFSIFLDEAKAVADRDFAVMFIDLDRFKQVNDALGHSAGDELMFGLSERLRKLLPEDSLLARLGGDEFGIILKNAEPGAGKPAGFIVMGNLLDAATLSEALQVKVDLNLAVRPSDIALLKAAPGKVASQVAPAMITTRLGLEDRSGRLLGTVDFGTPRDTTAAGQKGILLATAAMIAALFALLGVLAWANRAISVRRLRALEGYVRTMRSEDEPLPEAMTLGADEIASLAREFKALGEELDSAEEELRKSAYLQGKADSAAGMLHNVRNALVPIRVMQEKWLAEEALPFRLNLVRATAELDAQDLAPERRQQLVDFLVSAARKIALTSEGRRQEMEETKSSIDQIAAILTSYNFDTSGATAPDSIDLLKLLKQEAAAVNAAVASPIRFDLPAAVPVLLGNRVHFSQVLANVLVNAKEAMEAASPPEKVITVTVSDAADSMVEVKLSDNGDGIPADSLAAVFQRGYSTREHKSGGLGMHWSANVMRAMGGTIAIASDGPGLGATVTLVLPRKPAEVSTVALAAAA